MCEEELFDIKGYEGHYAITRSGKVWSYPKTARHATKHNGRWLNSFTSSGYQVYSLFINGKGKTYSLHRLLALTFIPNPENKPEVNHINGVKSDSRLENLEWCTASENIQHAYDTGLHRVNRGEKVGTSKLKPDDVMEIIRLHNLGVQQKDIVVMYSLKCRKTIRNITKGFSWNHLTGVRQNG